LHLLTVDGAGDRPSGVDGFEKGGLRCDPDDGAARAYVERKTEVRSDHPVFVAVLFGIPAPEVGHVGVRLVPAEPPGAPSRPVNLLPVVDARLAGAVVVAFDFGTFSPGRRPARLVLKSMLSGKPGAPVRPLPGVPAIRRRKSGGLECIEARRVELPACQAGVIHPGGIGLGHPGVAPVEMLIYECLAELPAGHSASARPGEVHGVVLGGGTQILDDLREGGVAGILVGGRYRGREQRCAEEEAREGGVAEYASPS